MDRILISHSDGRRYSVTRETFRDRYEPEGFSEDGLETDAAFVADVPPVPRRAGARRKSTKATKPARVATPTAVPTVEPETEA